MLTVKSGLEGGEERERSGTEGRRGEEMEVRVGEERGKRVKRQHHPPWCYTSVFGSVLSKFISGLER